MQQWKVSKVRLSTGYMYRLSGHSKRNSVGPTLENMNRASRDEERHDEMAGVKAEIAALRKELASYEEQLSKATRIIAKKHLEGRIKNIESEIKLKQSVLETMSRARASSVPCGGFSSNASGFALGREVTPASIESFMSTPSPPSSPEYHAQAEDLPDPVPVDIGYAPGSSLVPPGGLTASAYRDELARGVAADANDYHFQLGLRTRQFSKKVFSKIERKLKERIEFRKMLNQRFRDRLVEMEEGKKYCTKLEKLRDELKAARMETHKLKDSMKKAAETADGVLGDWGRLTRVGKLSQGN